MAHAISAETAPNSAGITREAVTSAGSGAQAAVACAVCEYATEHASYPVGKLTERVAGYCDACHHLDRTSALPLHGLLPHVQQHDRLRPYPRASGASTRPPSG